MAKLSEESLLMILYHAMGRGGVLNNPTADRLVFFLSFDVKYAPPEVIRREVRSAIDLGLVEIDGGSVKFTKNGLSRIEALDINMKSFVDSKLKMAMKLKESGAIVASEELMKKASGHYFWYPKEWPKEKKEEEDVVTKRDWKKAPKRTLEPEEEEPIKKLPPIPRKL